MGDYPRVTGGRVGVRSVRSSIDFDGEEETRWKFEYSYDVITSEFSTFFTISTFGSGVNRGNSWVSQTPGSFVFVWTLAIRPGVDFTGWAPYFVTGILQGTLLILCLFFKRRQTRLGIDDWGNESTKRGSSEGDERSRLLG